MSFNSHALVVTCQYDGRNFAIRHYYGWLTYIYVELIDNYICDGEEQNLDMNLNLDIELLYIYIYISMIFNNYSNEHH